MTPEQLESVCSGIFGESWKGPFADALGIDYSTRYRMLRRDAVEGPVAATVKAWALLHYDFAITPPASPTSDFVFPDFFPNSSFHRPFVGIEENASELFGKKWKTRLSRCLGIDRATLWRQMGHLEAPGPVISAIRAWELLKYLTGHLPPFDMKGHVDIEENVPVEPPPPVKKPRRPKKMARYARLLTEPSEEEAVPDLQADVWSVGG